MDLLIAATFQTYTMKSILIACEDGTSQVFIDKPINFVKPLSEIIERYKEYKHAQGTNS